MANTFHRFNDLPRELRDLIWNHALRPSSPGVHIFKLNYPALGTSNDGFVDVAASIDLASALRLDIPSRSPFFTNVTEASSNHSASWWKQGNPSTYLIDRGMWTACKESRLVIGRSLDWKHWCEVRRQMYSNLWSTLEWGFAPATIRFGNKDVKDRCYTVLPHQDLFVLQAHAMIGRYGLHFQDDLPWKFPRFHVLSIKHMGIEYNPAWGVEIQNAGSNYAEHDAIKKIMEAVYLYQHVWIVDYNLTRRPNVSGHRDTEDLGMVTFHASDRRFVEVECNYKGSSLQDWQYIQEKEEGSACCTSIEFIMKARDTWNADPSRFLYSDAKTIKLLGWERLEQSS
ncbi:hypothetical protein NW762_014269 [Fusarium torreyae]|uniref:2EXR domain-containing protein n=1 Tax=Fusarium torreyae TaxID=1237075 RepID=A0A9W8V6Z8_9HYPO|nr:hypothetical protein NW762_014269 [Fusarium torreyae]